MTSLDSPQRHEVSIAQFSLRDLLTIVFKRRLFIVTILFTVVAVVMLASLLSSRTYEVTATLLVNDARGEIPLVPAASQQVIISKVTEEDLNSEIEILKSRQLVEEVVETVGAGRSSSEEDSWVDLGINRLKVFLGGVKLSAVDGMAVNLLEEIEISSVRKSNMIRIAYQAEDPVWATRVVGTLIDRYLEQRVKRYQSPQAVVFFEQQMREAQKSAFRQRKGSGTIRG